MKFVTIKESHYQADLIVLKSRLESEGIQCLLKNELTSQVLNHIPAFVVELQVPEADLDLVKEIMQEMGEWPVDKSKPACPECGSEKLKLKLSLIKRIKLFFSILYVALGSNVPMDKLFRNAKYICKDCRHEFV